MNPYVIGGQAPSLRPSVFCFLDVLGYSEFSQGGAADDMTARLRDYHAALSSGATILRDPERQAWFAPTDGVHDAAVTAFTDNICLGFPIRYREDGEVELGQVLSRIGRYQVEMAIRGYFVRGAVAFGDVYIDEMTVFGAPLIEAHEGECRRAVNPRIIMSPSAREAAIEHVGYYGNSPNAPLTSDLKCDGDGEWFVDYLESLMLAPDEGVFGEQEIARHREAVLFKLDRYADNPRVLSKYAWIARYHNWFCRKYEAYLGRDAHVPGYDPAVDFTSIVDRLPPPRDFAIT